MTRAVHVRAEPAPPLLAEPETRVEGREKVTGSARYAADVHRPGELVARFLGSPLAHARIVRIDASRARALPGVHAVLTGNDVGLLLMGRRLLDWPVLGVDRVRYVGDRVAAVAAESVAVADEALSLIDVEYEELPAILDPSAALEAGAPILHDNAGSYAYLQGTRPAVPHPNMQGHRVVAKGEPDLAPVFANAAHVFEQRFTTPAQHPGYLEPHAALVWRDPSGTTHVLTTNKAPFALRNQMAATFGDEPAGYDVETAHIGGDFGGKGTTIDEYALVLLARATGRPIRSVATSTDELATMGPRHAAEIRLRTAVDAGGRFLAHEAHALFDGGAYAGAKPLPHLTLAGASNTLAAYHVPNVRLEISTVYTNHAPAGHMRAPGEVQSLFAGESHVDTIARSMGRDPLEFRLLNAVRGDDRSIDGQRFREARALEILERIGQDRPWTVGSTATRPDEQGRIARGRGVAVAVRHVGAGKTGLRMTLRRDGRIEAVTGIPDQGGGALTVIRRVVAAKLGVNESSVTVRTGSTAEAAFDMGVGGSRSTHLASQVSLDAVARLVDALEERLGPLLGEEVTVERGTVRGRSGSVRTLADVAALLPDAEGLSVDARYEAETHGPDEPGDFDFAGYAVEVEVDRETGSVALTDALLVADVGTIINPVAHRGQLIGGFAMGVGAALMEELVRSDGQVVSANLGDVKLPTSRDVPALRVVELSTTLGPGAFGAKMAGELTNTAVPPAIANAVFDAVGVRVTELPISAERVLAGLRENVVTAA